MMDAYTPTFAMAGTSMGMSIVGGKLGEHLPAGSPNPLVTGGKSIAKFVPVTATFGSAGIASKQLKKMIKDIICIKEFSVFCLLFSHIHSPERTTAFTFFRPRPRGLK